MATVDFGELSAKHTSEEAARRARRRYWAEWRLKAYGIGAIALAGIALAILLWTIVEKTASVIFEDYIRLEITVDVEGDDLEKIRDPNPRITPSLNAPLREGLAATRETELGRREMRQLITMLSGDAGFELGAYMKQNPDLVGETFEYDALVDDEIQMYLKGSLGELVEMETGSAAALEQIEAGGEGSPARYRLSIAEGTAFAEARRAVAEARQRDARRARAEQGRQQNAIEVMRQRLEETETEQQSQRIQERLDGYIAARDEAKARAEELEMLAADPTSTYRIDSDDPSVLIKLNGGWLQATELAPDHVLADALIPPESQGDVAAGEWSAYLFERPESSRNVSNLQIAWLEELREAGQIETRLNSRLLMSSDSSNAELAGIWGALVGSFWTMIVTFLIAFPVGVLASIYLEEFAPKNRFTDFIEVNINNLAAVPSIVFGLLGLAIFVSGIEFEIFGQIVQIGGWMPRSSPLAGGAVLALMTLPTIIIAGRASIRAVPPSIRQAALGLGASKLQTATHHVLPLALPGILTGSIIGMAQALGETAPLLMVGMNSFIQEPPDTPLEPANVLPTLIYQWNNNSERLFDDKTAAAISVLLIFLIAMNGLAVLLRKRFERRW